eukprot:TRINITY_DN5355_c0_g2_i1.p1 TRINITY_DN5355_c0_g2~~TRINITY_DN5355_c0_g2_i1.p1  ORF type:complete len:473 (+),score=92.84 TRINITY_DN5355_c0_g2_i1:107-1525(+)
MMSFTTFVALLLCAPAVVANRIQVHTADAKELGEGYDYCKDKVPFSIKRKRGSWRHNSVDCKCPKDYELTGASNECSRFDLLDRTGRKFRATSMEGKGCYCRQKNDAWVAQDAQLVKFLNEKSFVEYSINRIRDLTKDTRSKEAARKPGTIPALAQFIMSSEMRVKALKTLEQLTNNNTGNSEALTELTKPLRNLADLLAPEANRQSDVELKNTIAKIIVNLVTMNPESKVPIMQNGAADSLFLMLDSDIEMEHELSFQALKAIGGAPVIEQCNTHVVSKLADMIEDPEVSLPGVQRAVKLIGMLIPDNADPLTNSGQVMHVMKALVSVSKLDVKAHHRYDNALAMMALETLIHLVEGSDDVVDKLRDRRRSYLMRQDDLLSRLLDVYTKGMKRASSAAEQILRSLIKYGPESFGNVLMQKLDSDEEAGIRLIRQVVAWNYLQTRHVIHDKLVDKMKRGNVSKEVADLTRDI